MAILINIESWITEFVWNEWNFFKMSGTSSRWMEFLQDKWNLFQKNEWDTFCHLTYRLFINYVVQKNSLNYPIIYKNRNDYHNKLTKQQKMTITNKGLWQTVLPNEKFHSFSSKLTCLLSMWPHIITQRNMLFYHLWHTFFVTCFICLNQIHSRWLERF